MKSIDKKFLNEINSCEYNLWDEQETQEHVNQCVKIAQEYANNQIEKICDSIVIQKMRASKSDAEVRRIIRDLIAE
jgi:uncharacterized protein YihD (DUF1040 family)